MRVSAKSRPDGIRCNLRRTQRVGTSPLETLQRADSIPLHRKPALCLGFDQGGILK